MIKKILAITILFIITLTFYSCALLKKPIDKKSGFSNTLKQTEDYIRSDDWYNAKTALEISQKTWNKVKPFMQIDIDHDYVNDVENEFTRLNAYIDTKDQSEALASILLIQETWEDIGSL